MSTFEIVAIRFFYDKINFKISKIKFKHRVLIFNQKKAF